MKLTILECFNNFMFTNKRAVFKKFPQPFQRTKMFYLFHGKKKLLLLFSELLM